MFQPNDIEKKIYVAGLPWITNTESLGNYFAQFGEIVNANVVCDRATGRSKGFGFVTFREAESARIACENPNPIIDGRSASCKLAYIGARVHNNQSNQNGQHLPFYVPPPPYWNQYYQQQCYQYYPVFSTYPY